MYEGRAVQIPLDVWQDPQGKVVLRISDRDCKVYFGCWDAEGNPTDYLAVVTFDCHFGAKYFYSEFIPYEIEHRNYRSFILKVVDSQWLKRSIERQLKIYPNTSINPGQSWDGKPYQHYIIQGHDVYVEVIASEFKVDKIYKKTAGELAYLIQG